MSNDNSELIEINRLGPISFAIDSNQITKNSCRVLALFSPSLKPAMGINIKYRVIQGPLKLGEEGVSEITVQTNENGEASIDIKFTSRGYAIISAELPSDPEKIIFFEGHTEAMTDKLHIYSEPVFSINEGIVKCVISAVDHHNRPVKETNLVFEGHHGADVREKGTVLQNDRGQFEGTFKTQKAGLWNIQVQDLLTKVTANTWIHVTPGEPEKIVIGDIDPTSSRPYNILELKARLLDSFGNALDPHRIECHTKEVKLLTSLCNADEAIFPIKFFGYTEKTISLHDSKSNVSLKTDLLYPASWLEFKTPIIVNSEYKTLLYLNPEEGKPINKTEITVKFDAEFVSFVGIEEVPNQGTRVSTKREDGQVTIGIETKEIWSPEKYYEGIPICYLIWECLGEGDTCFEVSADI